MRPASSRIGSLTASCRRTDIWISVSRSIRLTGVRAMAKVAPSIRATTSPSRSDDFRRWAIRRRIVSATTGPCCDSNTSNSSRASTRQAERRPVVRSLASAVSRAASTSPRWASEVRESRPPPDCPGRGSQPETAISAGSVTATTRSAVSPPNQYPASIPAGRKASMCGPVTRSRRNARARAGAVGPGRTEPCAALSSGSVSVGGRSLGMWPPLARRCTAPVAPREAG